MRKALGIVLIAFAIFFILTQPQAAADVLKSIGSGFRGLFNSAIDFVNALAH